MKILNQLTIKHLKMNKRRTIVTIIGVILSTALMVGIGLLFSSARSYTIYETIRYNGNYHAEFKNITYEQQSLMEHNTNIQTSFYEHLVGYSILEEGQNEYKPYLALYQVSQNYFDQLNLVIGRFPENEDEIVISEHIKTNGGVAYELGSMITLALGERVDINGEVWNSPDYPFADGETVRVTETKTYKVVGIVERSRYENYSSPGYSIFTVMGSLKPNDQINTFVIYKDTKNVYSKVDKMATILGKTGQTFQGMTFYDDIKTNDALLSVLGSSRYGNVNNGISTIIIIILTVISIGCIIVIYNSFAISVMERKKQFGLFSSIGATKKQLRHTVFFEAFLVGGIGIPLGILGAFLGIGVVIAILNQLLKAVFEVPLTLTVYPTFLLIPLIFMIGVIMISAYLPAKSASKITPIEAIRLNDDIKIKNKKLKTPKWIRKMFGVEGEIALKNIKRNKKKYRITVASLTISIVMFLSFSSLLQYGLIGTNDLVNIPEHNIEISISDKDKNIIKQYENEFLTFEGVKKAASVASVNTQMASLPLSSYTKSAKNYFEDVINHNFENGYTIVSIVKMDDKSYQNLLKKYGYTGTPALFINRSKGVSYQDGDRMSYDFTFLETIPNELEFCFIEYDYDKEYDTAQQSYPILSKECTVKINEIKEIDEYPFGLSGLVTGLEHFIIVPEDIYEQVFEMQHQTIPYTSVYLDSDNYGSLDKYVEELEKSNRIDSLHYYNLDEELKLVNNMILAIELLLYGFIALVTLIGVTSVFNTISTSIALRRKEFAMLRSMGLTPKGFNRMIRFESLFFGLKSLFYALPLSLLVILLLANSASSIIDLGQVLIPVKSIGIVILGVFIIVFLSMIYSTRKIKKENILEAIREENI